MSRDGRDDAADIDRAFADIMSRWSDTAHRDDPASDETPADDGQTGEAADGPTPPNTADAADTADTTDTADAVRPENSTHEPENSVHEQPPAPARRPRSVEEVFGPSRETGWRVHTPPEENDDFVPPRPAPPAGNDVTFWLALAGIVGGPLWLIYLALAAPYSSRLWLVLAVTATLAGFGLMVMRLPAHRDPEEDDDGAVV